MKAHFVDKHCITAHNISLHTSTSNRRSFLMLNIRKYTLEFDLNKSVNTIYLAIFKGGGFTFSTSCLMLIGGFVKTKSNVYLKGRSWHNHKESSIWNNLHTVPKPTYTVFQKLRSTATAMVLHHLAMKYMTSLATPLLTARAATQCGYGVTFSLNFFNRMIS